MKRFLTQKTLTTALCAPVLVAGFSAAAPALTMPEGGNYTIGALSPAAFAAGSPDTLVTSATTNAPPAGTAQVCFYLPAAAAATAAPLSFTAPAAGQIAFTVPAAYLQAAPQSAFVSGSTSATVYFVAAGGTCTGTPDPAFSNSTTAQLNLPAVTGSSTTDLPENIPAAGQQRIRFVVTGSNFTPSSQVVFTAFQTHSGKTPADLTAVTTFLSPTALLATSPFISSDDEDATLVVSTPGANGAYTSASGAHLEFYNARGDAFTQFSASVPLTAGQPITFSATVAFQQGQVAYAQAGTVPTGPVTFGVAPGVSAAGTLSLVSGQASFAAAKQTPLVVNSAYGSLLADVNGDSLPDAVVLNVGVVNGSEHVYLTVYPAEYPLGNYQKPVQNDITSFCPSPERMTSGDMNGDGLADVVLTCDDSESGYDLFVLTSKGDGTLQHLPVATATASNVQTGDFFHHGKLDIATVGALDSQGSSYGVKVYENNGDGTFAEPVATTFSGNTFAFPNVARVADVNGDGTADLVLGAGPNLGVFLGNTAGTVGNAGSPNFSFTPAGDETQYSDIQVADVTGDGLPDIVAGVAQVDAGVRRSPGVKTGFSGGDNGIYVFPNSSAGFAAGFTNPVYSPTTAIPGLLAVGDFNGDGSADVLVTPSIAGSGTTAAATYTGDGSGSFTANTGLSFALPDGSIAGSLKATDLDGDGLPDVQIVPLYDGGYNVASWLVTGPASVTQSASLNVPSGDVTVSYSYPGNNTYIAAYTTSHLTVGGVPVTVALAASATQTTYGQPVSITATIVRSQPEENPFSGKVTFTANGVTLGAVGVNSSGVAVLNNVHLPAGTQPVMASYTGDPYDAAGSGSAGITVAPAALTVTANDQTKTQFQPNPPLTYTIAGFQYSETKGFATSGAPVLATTATNDSPVGSYPITIAQGTLAAPNYSLSFVPGTLTVSAAAFSLDSISPAAGNIGDGDTTITLHGAGFANTDVVTVNGTAVSSSYHSATTLLATIPAADFATPGTLAIAVMDPRTGLTTTSASYVVQTPPVDLRFTGPATSKSGTQPTLDFHLVNPYPVPLTVTLTLGFAASTSPAVDDPNIVFANGTRTYTFTVDAHSVTTPSVQLQAGTVAGAVTVTAQLSAAGVDVTPTDLAPVVVTIAPAIPVITGATVSASGDTLTVTITGFSNTREVQSAAFQFFPAAGDSFTDYDLQVDVTGDFGPYYSGTPSDAFGSEFTYTQQFTLNASASEVKAVLVTLVNSVGHSVTVAAQ